MRAQTRPLGVSSGQNQGSGSWTAMFDVDLEPGRREPSGPQRRQRDAGTCAVLGQTAQDEVDGVHAQRVGGRAEPSLGVREVGGDPRQGPYRAGDGGSEGADECRGRRGSRPRAVLRRHRWSARSTEPARPDRPRRPRGIRSCSPGSDMRGGVGRGATGWRGRRCGGRDVGVPVEWLPAMAGRAARAWLAAAVATSRRPGARGVSTPGAGPAPNPVAGGPGPAVGRPSGCSRPVEAV